jgi:hypothetical protein
VSVDLGAWQQGIAALIDGDASTDDEVLRERVEIVREIVRSWRELRIRTCCPLTTRLLEARGLFADTVAEAARAGVSPYREVFALAFLRHVLDRFEGQIGATAAFEEEMILANHE